MRDRVSVLETAVDNSVNHESPPGCAEMLRDIAFRAQLGVLCRALLGDPPADSCDGPVSSRCNGSPGLSHHLNVIVCRTVRHSLAPIAARW